MTTPINPAEPFTPFLPSTQNIPEEQDRLNVFLVDNLNLYADVINDKKIGVWVQGRENFDGNKWFYKTTKITRNGYQTFVFIESLPNAGVLTINLTTDPEYPIIGVDEDFVISLNYGTASKPPTIPDNTIAGTGDYFSYMARGDPRITFDMTNKQITITTTVDLSLYSGFLIINYIRDGT